MIEIRIIFLGTGSYGLDKYPSSGGIETQIWGLATCMVKRGHDVHILARYDGISEEEKDGVKIHYIKTHLKDQVLTKLIFSYNAYKLIKKLEPDAIYMAEKFSSYFVSKLNIPKIYVTHNKDAFEFYKQQSFKDNKINYLFFEVKKRLEENVMKRADMVCPNVESLEEYLHQRGISHTRLLPNAIFADTYRNNRDDKFIYFSGSLMRVKGVNFLIEAFNNLDPEFDDYRLIIGGEGPQMDELKKQVEKSRRSDGIDFISRVSHEKYREKLSNCTVFVLPSLSETFGIVLIEAMASGKPVIASNIVGPSDIIDHGIDGFLFEAGNINELKNYLTKILSDEKLREAMGQKGRKKVKQRYDFKNSADIFEKICLDITSKKLKV